LGPSPESGLGSRVLASKQWEARDHSIPDATLVLSLHPPHPFHHLCLAFTRNSLSLELQRETANPCRVNPEYSQSRSTCLRPSSRLLVPRACIVNPSFTPSGHAFITRLSLLLSPPPFSRRARELPFLLLPPLYRSPRPSPPFPTIASAVVLDSPPPGFSGPFLVVLHCSPPRWPALEMRIPRSYGHSFLYLILCYLHATAPTSGTAHTTPKP